MRTKHRQIRLAGANKYIAEAIDHEHHRAALKRLLKTHSTRRTTRVSGRQAEADVRRFSEKHRRFHDDRCAAGRRANEPHASSLSTVRESGRHQEGLLVGPAGSRFEGVVQGVGCAAATCTLRRL